MSCWISDLPNALRKTLFICTQNTKGNVAVSKTIENGKSAMKNALESLFTILFKLYDMPP